MKHRLLLAGNPGATILRNGLVLDFSVGLPVYRGGAAHQHSWFFRFAFAGLASGLVCRFESPIFWEPQTGIQQTLGETKLLSPRGFLGRPGKRSLGFVHSLDYVPAFSSFLLLSRLNLTGLEGV